MELNGTGSVSYSNYKNAMDYSMAVAGKAKDFTKQQGAAALTLINSATQVSKVSGAEALGSSMYGSKIDITA